MRHLKGSSTWSIAAAFVVGAVLVGVLPSMAQTSRRMMNLQGRLTDTEGSPTTGRHLFELRIFDSGPAGSGTQLYYEAQRVEVNKGIYNVLVGDGYASFTGDNPLNYAEAGGKTGGIPASVFNRDNLWLEIEIDEDNPLDPRTRIVSAAYAMNADTLDGSDSSAFAKLGDDAGFADLTATNLAATSLGAAAGSITDLNTNNISFTGGGELNSAKMSQLATLTDGSTTTLHTHPGGTGFLESPGGTKCQFRWAEWAGYVQSHGWRYGNDPYWQGGVHPSYWDDNNGYAAQMSNDVETIRTLFWNRGDTGGWNMSMYQQQWYMHSSTVDRHVAVLFRIKNSTGGSINWRLRLFTSQYSGWGSRSSVARNGQNMWTYDSNHGWTDSTIDVDIPANRTSTVIVIAGSVSESGGMRDTNLVFKNECLQLPAGLTYVDDLDDLPRGTIWDK